MNVVVHQPEIEGTTVECSVTPSGGVRRFFTGEPLRVEYDVDVADVPPEIAVIPALAHVCPVAWTRDADVHVPTVDESFRDSLARVHEVLRGMYPEFIGGGELRPAEVVDATEERSADEFDDVGLLFSGGVDSVASYVRHREAEPVPVSVQGWVVGVDQDDRWEGLRRHVAAFAGEQGPDVRCVRSNMLSFLDTPMLQAHYQRYVDGAWYSSVGHGLGLLGLCAPLSHELGLGTVHIAASHTAAFEEPWGSHPAIDDEVGWAHTRGNHDGYGLSRQEKVELIAEYARREGRTFPLRTCIHSETGGNCNECEKCYRTMCGLVLAGLDPNEFGYEMGPETFEAVRAGFEAGEFRMEKHTAFHWRDIQHHVELDREFPVAGAREFFAWLRTVDVGAAAGTSATPVGHRVLQGVARHVPYALYDSLYPVYDALRDRA
jgi:hypothetical protein